MLNTWTKGKITVSVASAKPKPAARPNNQLPLIIGAIVGVAAIAVLVLIALSGQGGESFSYDTFSPSHAGDGGFMLGDPNAPVTIIEFADYACPACQQYHPEMTQFISEFVGAGKAAFEYRVFPTAGQQRTVFAGEIAACMGEENPLYFWTALGRFTTLAQQGRYDDAPRIIAQELGLNYADLLSCQQTSTYVDESVSLGEQLRVSGTPAVRIRYGDSTPTVVSWGGQTYDRGGVPLDVLRQVVNAAQPAS
jgi:protein-disulfide isomerase